MAAGLIIPALWICSGIVLYTGVQAAVVGLVGNRVPLYLTFSLTCLCAAGYQLALVQYYRAPSLAVAVAALHWPFGFIMMFHPAFFGFVALYAGQRRFKPWLIAVTAIFAALFVACLASPFTLRFTTMEADGVVRLPWGEALAHFRGEAGIWNLLARLATWAVLGWAMVRTVVQFRRGERRAAIFLAVCVALLLAASVQGAMIDWGLIDSFYTAGFAFLALAALMSVSMGMELRDRTLDLEATTSDLHQEIERRQGIEKAIKHMAYHDDLTGLANRVHFHEHLSEAVERARSSGEFGAMLLIDLDHFKTINDALSHVVGDEVLCEVGHLLTATIAGRAFVARLGGDEFVAVMGQRSASPQESAFAARRLAEAVTETLSRPLTVGERILNVGASIGIAPFPHSGSTPQDILRQADMALYRAKNLGRGTIQFYESPMQEAVDERLKLEKGLREALENDEFMLHFQPQLDLTGRMVGVEALLRWCYPKMGNIPPSLFIPVAEESGLIHAVGTWVLDQACDRLTRWMRAGVSDLGELSVNVSPWQFTRPDFVQQVAHIFAKRGADPRRLTLEITETALLYDLGETIEKLNALREMGLRIALDDFGTGYSSLAHLKSLPFDELKIDRSFVGDLATGTDRALVQSIIAIGQHMKIRVIAEGVESSMQRDLLVEMGCECFQGYLFCQPLAEHDFLHWIDERGHNDGRLTHRA
jgi:diguanylate cyclase (GGDEF)-like protein